MITIRPSTPAEIPQQKDLWKKCFGDPSAYINTFYEKFCTAEQVLVVEDGGEIDSMAAVLPSTLQLPDGSEIKVGYIYALATNPNVQGKGHARQLLSYADQYLQEQGMKAMVLVPASASLHRFFAALGMSECFGTREVQMLTSNLTNDTEGCSMAPITSHEYNQIRESFLTGTFHMTYEDQRIELQKFASQMSSADLYKIEVDGEVGCAAIEVSKSRRLLAKELILSPKNLQKAANLLGKEFDATSHFLRTPAFWEGLPGSYIQAFGMIKWYDSTLRNKWFSREDAYLGLAFD